MVENKELDIDYDELSDVLYISFGKPKPAFGTKVGDGQIIRTDQDTGEVCGITIFDFKKIYMDKE